jgi:hypothetical protein
LIHLIRYRTDTASVESSKEESDSEPNAIVHYHPIKSTPINTKSIAQADRQQPSIREESLEYTISANESASSG